MVTIRVFLIDGSTEVRKGLAARLNRQPDIEVVGAAQSITEGAAAARQVEADVIVVDVPLRHLTRELFPGKPPDQPPVVIGVAHLAGVQGDPRAHGVDVLVEKSLASEALITAIRAHVAPRRTMGAG